MTSTVIEARELHCSYGDFEAVSGIDLDVRRGELYALLGTNGAGKTTTLETLEGHRRPTSGSVRVLGGDPRSTAVRLRTGMMLQESGFAAELTVAETLRLWARVARRADDDDTLIERLDLTRRRDVRVGRLSGGEKRRLDLAMAVYGRPELLFLDEPTAGLDPQSRDLLWDLVRELLDDGATVVLTTHYLEEAGTIADRIAIMREGRIAVEGTLADLLAPYPARITLDLSDGISATDLPLAADVASSRGQRITIATDDLQRDMARLLTWADERRLHLRGLVTHPPTLDDVFRAVAQATPERVSR
ncbi:ABC transporter ATP-binding protein (plasmid) [Embleya sp. NBC_00888]|uniref:ABC transporter ATP-binding protein n=1 Tax=Embleya sp. NBC_00888 TaxID=2975960 RepID=UPI00386D6315|nr:ABC transporter ATP-binding protein [Embleya sp. NBC_00888]